MMNILPKSKLFASCFYLPRLSLVATLKLFGVPPSFDGVEFPEKNKLRFLEKVPVYPPGVRPPKCYKNLIDIRGPELVHDSLIHKQYGLIALNGGYLLHGHLEMIRNTINRRIDAKNMFAIWRIDAPWKPITKKGQGKRMGGGKGAIHHYVTPVKAGRVIIEVGGRVQFPQVRKMLEEVRGKMPVRAVVVSQEYLDKMKEVEKREKDENINPYTFQYIAENNFLGCHQWISPYDLFWQAKYR